MIRRPPRSTRTDTLFPYTTLFRSGERLRDFCFKPGQDFHDLSLWRPKGGRLIPGDLGLERAFAETGAKGRCKVTVHDRQDLSDPFIISRQVIAAWSFAVAADRKSTRLNSSH